MDKPTSAMTGSGGGANLIGSATATLSGVMAGAGARGAMRDWGNAVFLALATGLGASLLIAAAVVVLSMGAA